MSDFKFNFSDDDSSPQDKGSIATDQCLTSGASVSCRTHTVGPLHKNLASLATPLSYPLQDIELKYLTAACVEAIIDESNQSHEAIADFKALLSTSDGTDLIPSVYEGGLVAWEGAFDLVSYLSESQFDFTGMDVLELGCGSGLPAIYTLMKGARAVSLQDYNYEVINCVTIPSVLCNERNLSLCNPSLCNFYSGSWDTLREAVPQSVKFDVILTSETIYSESSQTMLLSAMKSLLKLNGTIFVAAKSYYFGVGGSSAEFQEMVSTDEHFSCEIVKTLTCSVPRVIMTLKPR